MNPPKKIAALHDLSCLGRCALTVIIPTLSVMGYQVIPVPTALLSTHTGGYTDLHFCDLTDNMGQISAHFERLDTRFDSIYTGFLGSTEQIQTVECFIKRFGSEKDGIKPLILIDPVMGEDGELYSTYTEELADGIRHLCQYADIITPNLTEACFLTGFPYRNTKEMCEIDARTYANELMDRLEAQYSCRIAITGIRLHNGGVANLCSDENKQRFFSQQPECGHSYPGTGDIFASVLLGKLIGGESFPASVDAAADFVAHLIRSTIPLSTATREGVALEPELWRLIPKQID